MYLAVIRVPGFHLKGVVGGKYLLYVQAVSLELKNIPGSYAASWQSTYAGRVSGFVFAASWCYYGVHVSQIGRCTTHPRREVWRSGVKADSLEPSLSVRSED